MDVQNEKCVMVIDENLPSGMIANTAAIMGITLGKQMPEVVGAEVYDKTGKEHLGIIEFPVPVLKGNPELIRSVREKLYEPEFSDLTVVDFTELAQGCKTYDEFMKKNGRRNRVGAELSWNSHLRGEKEGEQADGKSGAFEIALDRSGLTL